MPLHRIYQCQTFESFRDRDSAAVFCDMEFERCYFESCALSITATPELRTTLRNIRLLNCSQRGCSLYAAILDNVFVDGFRTFGQLVQIWGAAFRHVVFQGKIDRVMISSLVSPTAKPKERQAFDESNARFYAGVDWALDISRGEFKEICIRGLPAHLIRRDPETQLLVKREKALQRAWKGLEFHTNLWPASLDLFLDRDEPAIVLAAPKRHARFREHLDDLQTLRKAGIAEAD